MSEERYISEHELVVELNKALARIKKFEVALRAIEQVEPILPGDIISSTFGPVEQIRAIKTMAHRALQEKE